MMRRQTYPSVFIIFLLALAAAPLSLAAIASAAPEPQQAPVETTSCAMELSKTVSPDMLLLGGRASVTMVMSYTCPAERMPLDIVFLLDESHSMVRESSRGGIDPGQPTPPSGFPTRVPPTRMPPPPPPLARAERLGSFFPRAARALQEPPPERTPGGPGGNDAGRGDPPGCEDLQPGNDPGATPRTTPTRPSDPPGPVPPAPFAGDQPDQDPPTRTPVPNPGGVRNEPVEEPGGEDDLLREVRAFMLDFAQRPEVIADLESDMLRVGAVAFNDRVRTLLSLSSGDRGKQLGAKAAQLRGRGNTRIDLGVQRARTELNSLPRGADRNQVRRKVLVILSDANFCQKDLKRARASGQVDVVTIFFGRSGFERRLRDLASEPQYALKGRDFQRFMELYVRDFARGDKVTIEELLVSDELTDVMQLVPGSVVPEPSKIEGQTIEWWGVRPGGVVTTTPRITITSPMTFTYDVEPSESGLHWVSKQAHAVSKDSEGRSADDYFPNVLIEVLAPTATPTNTPTTTATPTNTPTATPTNTPTPAPQYFPVALKQLAVPTATPEPCQPSQQKVDVVIVVDTSDSMTEPTEAGGDRKIDAAVRATKELVKLLKLPASNDGDQASVVWFNTTARALTQLTGDRPTIDAALDALPSVQASGTRIDLGLQAALDELQSGRARPGSTRSIVLITDGRQISQVFDNNARAVAAVARAAGIVVFTVGLGSDIDDALLAEIATSSDHYKKAPNTSDLELIYREIAAGIPCPGTP